MLRNLARSLFEHERIKTTEAKAKMLRPYAEKLITKAKKGSIHHRRQVLSVIENREVVHKLFADIGPRFSERNGGYTRILKIGPRNGDAAPMVLIELVDEGLAVTVAEGDGTERKRRGRKTTRRRTEGTESTAAVETPEVDEAGASPGDADADSSQGTPGDAAPEGDQDAADTPDDASGAQEEAVEASAEAAGDDAIETQIADVAADEAAEGETGADDAPDKQA